MAVQEIGVYENTERFADKESETVSRVSQGSMTYPCVILEHTQECPIKKHQLEALKRMISSVKPEEDAQYIDIYIKLGENIVKQGRVSDDQTKLVYEIFKDNEKYGFYDETTKLTGDMLYTLC